VLDSKVERIFRERGWAIIWTPPYAPKFQPIELVWGIGKQRAGTLYKPGRNLEQTRADLRSGWYGGLGSGTKIFEPCYVRGCWETAKREMNTWIAMDKSNNDGRDGGRVGVTGELGQLEGGERWTGSSDTCLSIDDMGDVFDFDDIKGLIAQQEEYRDIVQVNAAHLGGLD
jgi:hypothetical protein